MNDLHCTFDFSPLSSVDNPDDSLANAWVRFPNTSKSDKASLIDVFEARGTSPDQPHSLVVLDETKSSEQRLAEEFQDFKQLNVDILIDHGLCLDAGRLNLAPLEKRSDISTSDLNVSQKQSTDGMTLGPE